MDQFEINMSRQVSKTVADTVQSGITKSYSEAVGTQEINFCTAILHENLKSVAKEKFVEDELSETVMIFGLPENDSENVCENVSKVFEELNKNVTMNGPTDICTS